MFSPRYKHYVLGILTLVYTLNYLDRCLILLLLEPIKLDLGLSDTQLGFLTGIAFGLFYATLGLPIARWADRGNRVKITSWAIGLWGLTVTGCLLVRNFSQLVFARVAASVGESGCMPPTYSLLADYFPGAAERTRAMAIYWLASPLSALVSFILGGWLHAHYGWRATFFWMGLPGLLVAVVVKLTVAEPREWMAQRHGTATPAPHLREVARALWQQPATRQLSLALILLLTMALGLAPWYAAFLMRSHGMGTQELGVWLGLIFGMSGVAGILLGGYVSAGLLADNERTQMRASAIVMILLVPCFAVFLLVPHRNQALAALVPLQIAFNCLLGPTFALLQRLVPEHIRATTMALVMLVANLIGMGVGPQMVGVLSDWFHPTLGNDSLRYAMLVVSFVALWAAYHFWQVGETVKQALTGQDISSALRSDPVALG